MGTGNRREWGVHVVLFYDDESALGASGRQSHFPSYSIKGGKCGCEECFFFFLTPSDNEDL